MSLISMHGAWLSFSDAPLLDNAELHIEDNERGQTSTASIRNCCKTSLARAPTAMRMPISRVRSVTDTSIIFITPIPPTTSEITATSVRNSCKVRARYKDFIVLVANNTYRNLQLFHCLKPIKKAQNPAPFTSTVSFYCRRPWHCLYFLPEPHGQGSLRPTLRSPVCAASAAAAAESSS